MNLEAWVKESWDCDPGWIWELGQLGSLSHCQELCGLGQVTFGFLFYKMWGWVGLAHQPRAVGSFLIAFWGRSFPVPLGVHTCTFGMNSVGTDETLEPPDLWLFHGQR